MTVQQRHFKVQLLAKTRATLADGQTRPPILTVFYQRAVTKLERELAA